METVIHILQHCATTRDARGRVESLRSELEAPLTPTQIEAIQPHAGDKTFEAVVEELLR